MFTSPESKNHNLSINGGKNECDWVVYTIIPYTGDNWGCKYKEDHAKKFNEEIKKAKPIIMKIINLRIRRNKNKNKKNHKVQEQTKRLAKSRLSKTNGQGSNI